MGLYNANDAQQGIDRRISVVASTQHGVFNRTQAVGCGATKEKVRWRLRTGRWEQAYPTVYRLAGSTCTWRQLAMAACLHLGPRAVLSYRAAAALRRWVGFSPSKLELTLPREYRRKASDGITVHFTTHPIPLEDISTIDGIPVTKPARTLLDLATVEREDVIARCLDDLLRRRPLSLSFLERWLADPRRKRHRGARVLRRLMEARATVGVTDSPLESDVLKLLHEGGLPTPMLQYVVRDGERFVGRVDFAYPMERVAIEADGFRFHDTRETFDSERARSNELEALGWHVLRLTAKHLDHPKSVMNWVRAALDYGRLRAVVGGLSVIRRREGA